MTVGQDSNDTVATNCLPLCMALYLWTEHHCLVLDLFLYVFVITWARQILIICLNV